MVATITVLVIASWAAFVLLTPHALHGPASDGNPGGPKFVVDLGNPAPGNVTCGGGGSATVERIGWLNATGPVTTWDVVILVRQVVDPDGDGDYIASSGPAPNVSATSQCVGPALTAGSTGYSWYVVLSNATGANIAYYSYVAFYTLSDGWLPVGNGSSNVPIENGSALTLVSTPSLVRSGYDLEVAGTVGGNSGNFGWVPL